MKDTKAYFLDVTVDLSFESGDTRASLAGNQEMLDNRGGGEGVNKKI